MNSSRMPFELLLGWRYTRAGRAARRNRFISFISSVSMLGIALGVAALIIVLSVMNGFQQEVRDRMLGVLSHIEVLAYAQAELDSPAWLQQKLARHPQVLASESSNAPALISHSDSWQSSPPDTTRSRSGEYPSDHTASLWPHN